MQTAVITLAAGFLIKGLEMNRIITASLSLALLVACCCCGSETGSVEVGGWERPASADYVCTDFASLPGEEKAVWGVRGGVRKIFFEKDRLPSLFERTLVLETWDPNSGSLDWIFTGPRGGVTVELRPGKVTVVRRAYDSPTFGEGRHPEKRFGEQSVSYSGALKAITVRSDYRLEFSVALNGAKLLSIRPFLHDLSRHQFWIRSEGSALRGSLLSPAERTTEVKVNPSHTHQRILGFGGIASMPSYGRLSERGKRMWWELLREYNLLVQREYPNSLQLKEDMTNFDDPDCAVPHYYGDNFPNSEISDFDYLQRFGQIPESLVVFEFWHLPPWTRNDADRYAEAMLGYCRQCKQHTGRAPQIVGIQNEIRTDNWKKMAIGLRRKLNEQGFAEVEIHSNNASRLEAGLEWIEDWREDAKAWGAVDYTASNMYDYQNYFTEPDKYDTRLEKLRRLSGEKPFLAVELCINDGRYQWPSYRVALPMAQLYHKCLTIADAAMVNYCWTLLDIEQPSYGWTRSLFVIDPQNGFVPAASSNQLRCFAAYSRRIRRDMQRVEASAGVDDLLVCAFEGKNGAATLVALNRSTAPRKLKVDWPGVTFAEYEVADPYNPNSAMKTGPDCAPAVPAGGLVTLTNVPLSTAAD